MSDLAVSSRGEGSGESGFDEVHCLEQRQSDCCVDVAKALWRMLCPRDAEETNRVLCSEHCANSDSGSCGSIGVVGLERCRFDPAYIGESVPQQLRSYRHLLVDHEGAYD